MAKLCNATPAFFAPTQREGMDFDQPSLLTAYRGLSSPAKSLTWPKRLTTCSEVLATS